MSADRNLLFGIVALQMDFVNRDALIQGMNAWVLEKRTSLAEILQRQGAISADERALLEPLVAKHLHKHGNDPEKSLASLNSIGSVRHDLGKVADADVQQSLRHVSAMRPADPHVTNPPAAQGLADAFATVPPDPGKTDRVPLRFRVLRPHAKGGLGEVFVARDQELNRDVALKEIQLKHADDPDSRCRFVVEAEITGGLEHPGIVPVYGLGCYPDGRPFYAMRFIRGDSLKDAIQRYHGQSKDGRPLLSSAEQNLALRQLLGRFIDVCQAVAYAHSRGVLHRDLKPGNIMLGKYGETLVVDWGLAKPLGASKTAATTLGDETPLQLGSLSGSSATLLGQAVGTPAFMSPEQAAGKLDQLGPASDVYSLGATLCALLTGHAPVEEQDVGLILQKVQRGEFLPPRRIKSDLPKALEAICLKTMALEPKDRYATALDLAADVEHWLADELVTAYRESLPERTTRWARQHRTLVTTAAALLVTVALGLGIGFAIVRAEQQETAKQRNEAKENLAKAQGNLKLAKKAVDDCFLVAKEHLLLQQEQMKEVKKLLLEKALPYYENFQQARSDDQDLQWTQADNYLRVAYITNEIGNKDAARTAYGRALELYDRLAAANPRLSESQDFQSALAGTYNNLALIKRDTGQVHQAETIHEQARKIQEKLSADNPGEHTIQNELARTYNNLALLQHNTGRPAEAENLYQKARQIQERLTANNPDVIEFQRGLATTYHNLGLLQRDTARVREAENSYEQARKIREKLAADNPNVNDLQCELAHTYHNLGVLHRTTNRVREAEVSYTQARKILERLLTANPGVLAFQEDLASTYTNLGVLQRHTNRIKEAEASYEEARKIQVKLVAANPNVTDFQGDLARTCYQLGNLQSITGRPGDAEASYEQARKTFEALACANSSVGDFQDNWARTCNALAVLQRDKGQFREAEALFDRARKIQEKLAAENPNVNAFQSELARTYYNLGLLQRETKRMHEAEASYDQARKIREKLVADSPSVSTFQDDLARSYLSLGVLQQTTSRLREAEASYEQARKIREKLAAENPSVSEFQSGLALANHNLGIVQHTAGRLQEAEASYEQARKIREKLTVANPSVPDFQDDLAETCYNLALLHAWKSVTTKAKDPRLSEQYAARAVGLLWQAEAKGYFKNQRNLEQLKKGADRHPLRERKDFQDLLRRLEAASTGSK